MARKHDLAKPTWSQGPQKNGAETKLEIVRVPPAGLGGMIVLSKEPIGCKTHYIARRTVPCLGKNCPACEVGATSRWYGWLHVTSTSLTRQSLLEYTAAASELVLQAYEQHGTLRGLQLTARRIPRRANGRIILEFKAGSIPERSLPPEANREAILSRMWELSQKRRGGETLREALTQAIAARTRPASDMPEREFVELNKTEKKNGRLLA